MPDFLDKLLCHMSANDIQEMLGTVSELDSPDNAVHLQLYGLAQQRESELIAQHVMYPDYY